MKSIEKRFQRIQAKNPYWSSVICFAETVKGQNFSDRAIHHWFHELVNTEDYDPRDKKGILESLGAYTKSA